LTEVFEARIEARSSVIEAGEERVDKPSWLVNRGVKPWLGELKIRASSFVKG
jgi:hypothetical protein